mgnify:CR=1 FL=1
MKTLKINEYIQQDQKLKDLELEYERYGTSPYCESAMLNNLNQSKQYREIFNDFTIAFEQYVELIHKGDPMAEQFYQNALRVFGERLHKYTADYAERLVLEENKYKYNS